MYLKNFNIKYEPFATTPDPRFLYLGDIHKKALDRLMAAVTLRRGITALIGEPGLGKSTLLRTLLAGLEKSVNFAWVFNTTMDGLDLLTFICRDFGFMPKSNSKSDVLIELYTFFIREFEQRRIPLLIIDEAQNLKPEALEEIRQLSNLETVNKKLVQIILCGQPQLDAYLNMPELIQLKQRICFKATLSRLTCSETMAYVRHRLTVSEAQNPNLFSDDALKNIHDISGGIPRLINQICENALHTAANRGLSQIDALIIRELVENGDVMKAPAPEKSIAAESPIENVKPKPRLVQKVKPATQFVKPRVIETKYDVFEAIDLAELLSVI